MRTEWQMIKRSFKVCLWLFLFPFVAGRWLGRTFARVIGVVVLSTRDVLLCSSCSGDVMLVGRWLCSWCDYVFDGFAFARCPVCFAVPPFIECQSCGAGVRNPLT